MKELFNRGLSFIKNNPTIIYSLLLIFIVTGAIFLNSYFILTRFQDNFDKMLRSKAVLAENVIGVTARDYFSDLSNNKDKIRVENKLFAAQIQNIDVELLILEKDYVAKIRKNIEVIER